MHKVISRMCRRILTVFSVISLWIPALSAQQKETETAAGRLYIPMSIEDIVRQQTTPILQPRGAGHKLNERLNTLNDIARHARDYALGAGDAIEVTVLGVPALDKKEFALSSQGMISLPYIGEVQLLGMTAREAETKIASLFEVSLVVDPAVTVSIKTYKSQSFYIFGAVNKPGVNQIIGDTYLLDALTMAGGLQEKADTRIQIHHGGSGNGVPASRPGTLPPADSGKDGAQALQTLEIDLTDLLEKGDMSRNVRIQSGDVISVPERQEKFYYVLGDVQKPGAYAMRKSDRMTLSKAIATAGGILPTGSGKSTTIMRPNADGVSATPINVDAIAVIKGKGRDVEIAENDIVLVPGSASKTMSRSIMSGITGFMTTLLVLGVR